MSNSCFSIISCGGRDAIDNDDLESSPQTKGATDKRGWSFRKRSARHRVLSNTVISETPPSGIKDSPESAAVGIQTQPNSTIPDKISAVQWTEEKPPLPTIANPKLSEIIAAEANDTKADATPDESVVIIIQASVRGFLARKLLLKNKSIIKLQAAVRGHLVRRQAVGTLRCVQAIIKMQALVRARLARVLEEQSYSVEKQNVENGKDNVSTPMGKGNSGSKPLVTYTSIEKLLSNKFASQLLESTPKTKTINIKCDPLKSDSAWKWLQRWMSDSLTEKERSLDTMQPEEIKIKHVDTVEQEEKKIAHVDELSINSVQQEEKKIDHVDHGCELPLNTEQPEVKKIDHGGELSLDTVQPGEKIEHVELSLDSVQLEEKKIDHGGELSLDTVQPGEKIERKVSLDTVLPGEEKIEDTDKQEESVEILSEQYCKPTIEASENYEQPEPYNTNEINSEEITSHSIPTQTTEPDFGCKPEPDTIPAGSDTDLVQNVKRTTLEQPETEKRFSSRSRLVSNSVYFDAQSDTVPAGSDTDLVQNLKRTAPEQPETEKNFSSRSRQVSNSAFFDAHSKFEELSIANSTKSTSSTNQNTGVDSYTEIVSSSSDHSSSIKKSDLAENYASDTSKVQYGGSDTPRVQLSECETELSISSTLDSPDRSEAGANEFEPESKGNFEVEAESETINLDSGLLHADAVLPERSTGNTNGNDDANDSVISLDLSEVEKKSNIDVGELTNVESDLPHSNAVPMEGYSNTNGANDDAVDSAMSVDLPQVEKKANTDVFELQTEEKSEKSHQIFKSSPAASPRSHVTGSEPQGTPSSEVSVKLKRTRSDKSGSNNKRKSLSTGKTSPSNPNHDTKARKSIEKLPKDHKSAKRRNSFGSPKPDHVDQEPRDSSSSNPLPSYMQPTKSAKAKALPNSSPMSSPDVQDKEFYVKKRHSLPGANGRDGSPQIQRAIPEVQQTAKVNGTQSPQEKKWRR